MIIYHSFPKSHEGTVCDLDWSLATVLFQAAEYRKPAENQDILWSQKVNLPGLPLKIATKWKCTYERLFDEITACLSLLLATSTWSPGTTVASKLPHFGQLESDLPCSTVSVTAHLRGPHMIVLVISDASQLSFKRKSETLWDKGIPVMFPFKSSIICGGISHPSIPSHSGYSHGHRGPHCGFDGFHTWQGQLSDAMVMGSWIYEWHHIW